MTARTAQAFRKNTNTSIELRLNLDGTGTANVTTGIGFLDHLFTTLAFHSRIDLDLSCDGDIRIDDHHTAEDCGAVLGATIAEALDKRAGLATHGCAHVAMDDALARAVIDLSGAPYADLDLGFTREHLGSLACESAGHVLESLARHARFTLHVDLLKGSIDHHRAVAAFSAVGSALRSAMALDSTSATPRSAGLIERGPRG